jgi:hypothetical protein
MKNQTIPVIISLCIALIAGYAIGSHFTFRKIYQEKTIIDTFFLKKDSLIYKDLVKSKTLFDTLYLKDSLFLFTKDTIEDKIKFDSIVKMYVSRNVFSDTFKIDSTLLFFINDTVQYNLLTKRSYEYKLSYPKYTIKKVNSQLFLGPNFQLSKDYVILSGNLLLKNKRDNIYSLSIGMDNNKNLVYGGGYLFKIW